MNRLVVVGPVQPQSLPSTGVPRAFLITVFAVGIVVAVVVSVLGFYGYIGAGIP